MLVVDAGEHGSGACGKSEYGARWQGIEGIGGVCGGADDLLEGEAGFGTVWLDG